MLRRSHGSLALCLVLWRSQGLIFLSLVPVLHCGFPYMRTPSSWVVVRSGLTSPYPQVSIHRLLHWYMTDSGFSFQSLGPLSYSSARPMQSQVMCPPLPLSTPHLT